MAIQSGKSKTTSGRFLSPDNIRCRQKPVFLPLIFIKTFACGFAAEASNFLSRQKVTKKRSPWVPGLMLFGSPRFSPKSALAQLADLLRRHVITASKSGSNKGLAWFGFCLRDAAWPKGAARALELTVCVRVFCPTSLSLFSDPLGAAEHRPRGAFSLVRFFVA
ncbi:MAG: hypothetical protein PVG50_00930 [Thiohalophilus sp.]|jgi:hypothetical protein